MELLLELLFTVGVSVFFSFFLAKLFSMASSDDFTENNCVFAPGMDVISKTVVYESKQDKRSVVYVVESERRVGFDEEAVRICDHEEEEGFGVDRVVNKSCESLVICNDNVIDDDEKLFTEVGVVGLEEKCRDEGVCSGELKEEKETFDEFEENVAHESFVTVKSCESQIESNHLVEKNLERSEFREIQIESRNLVEKDPENLNFRKIQIESNNIAEKSPKRLEYRGIEIGSVKESVCETEEVGVLQSKANDSDEVKEEEGWLDDWEGIERTDLEKRFGDAVVFVGSKSNDDQISSLGSAVKMELYGLHKVAIEGPCFTPQPMALKVSARGKWHAWQRLGNISREEAMENYITILSRSVIGWMGDATSEDDKQTFQDGRTSENPTSNLQKQPDAEYKRKSEELKPSMGECDATGIEASY